MSVVIYGRSGGETACEASRLGEALLRRFASYPEAHSIVVGDGPPSSEGYRVVESPARCDVHYLRTSADGRLRWAGPVKLRTARCGSLREAMAMVTEQIVPTGHGHIVHTCRGVQVVDRARILGGGDVRPMAHLPFDGGVHRFEVIVRVLDSAWGDELLEYDLAGIPCFGLPLEGDAGSMERTLHGLVAAIDPPWLEPPGRIQATVYDEAPPGTDVTTFVGGRRGTAKCPGGLLRRGSIDRHGR